MRKFYKGFTLVEIMIVVAIIGLLVAIALPNFIVARKKSAMNSCKANLKQIDGAIQQYLLDTANGTIADLAEAQTKLCPTYIKGSTLPKCSGYGDYTIVNVAAVAADPTANPPVVGVPESIDVSCVDGALAVDYPHLLAP